MDRSESIQQLSAALVKAQAELKSAKCDGKNPFFNSRYATLGSVIETARPVLAKYGLAVSQPIVSDGENVGVETILLHESGEFISDTCCVRIEPFGKEFDKDGKEKSHQKPVVLAGGTISYMRRYGLASILGIYSEEEVGHQQQRQATQPVRSPVRTAMPIAPRPSVNAGSVW